MMHFKGFAGKSDCSLGTRLGVSLRLKGKENPRVWSPTIEGFTEGVPVTRSLSTRKKKKDPRRGGKGLICGKTMALPETYAGRARPVDGNVLPKPENTT